MEKVLIGMKRDFRHNGLDLFRMIATIQVFLGHVITHFAMADPPVELVYFVRGVPILFVLCGFLAAQSLDKYDTKTYLIRRAARILPGFWACIAINTVILLLIYDRTPTAREFALYCATQLSGLNFYTGDWLREYGVGTPNGVLWTIGVQLQFFLIAPLLHRLLKQSTLRRSGVVVGALLAVSILLNRSGPFLPALLNKLMGVTVVPYLYFLVIGMAGYYHRDKLIPVLEKYRWALLAGYIFWKIGENHLQFPHIFDGVLYNTVTTALMALVVLSFAFTFRWRVKRDYTYGFYLYHMVFINIAIELGCGTLCFDLSGILLMTGLIAAAVLCAVLSQKFIENPAARLAAKKG